jgi:tRNA-Thr(GGU) m(6)t(6)A37 methyltransferase TsaA
VQENEIFPGSITLEPIGIVRSDHREPAGVPIQPIYARGCRGIAELRPELAEGLENLDGFSHLHLIYYFHKAPDTALTVKPFFGDQPRGVFATRSPRRPNHIGLSIVRLIRREGARLYLDEVDIVDGAPLLDLKPFVTAMDNREGVTDGWLSAHQKELADRGTPRVGT